ncbi:B-cell antigen receptor complex-associated protein beta chain [Syngnathus typhle]|uniref:B-cell antigen receptor complex-associated protein beta chain n=1 Tax=Syngnathus typhle TaxID=161592 RepID=UPI002A6AAC50|nr:B-cell antigen receptor complex-associated protein beta chain [Syngnathus typhle]
MPHLTFGSLQLRPLCLSSSALLFMTSHHQHFDECFLCLCIMIWFLYGLCALTLLHVSVAVSRELAITQKPRFYGVRPGRYVTVYCASSHQHLPAEVHWYKADRHDQEVAQWRLLDDAMTRDKDLTLNAFLILHDLSFEDSGVYFCRINKTWGSGTQLQVARPINRAQAVRRSNVKDALMVVQGLMLAVIVALLLRRNGKMLKTKEHIYEEPEIEHIYEGLTIEACGGGELYEELTVYASTDDCDEAPWE